MRPAGVPHRLLRLTLLALPAIAVAFAARAAEPLPAVVVWDFDNQTPTLAAAGSAPADFLRRSLSESLTAALIQVPGLPVVERQRLKDLLAELKVSASDLSDEDARVKLGRIIGASRMVFGGYFVLGEEVQVHVRMVDTATTRVLFSDEVVAPMAAVMQQVEPLNQRLARALGGGKVAGREWPAALWQAYDRALALADGGRYDESVQALQNLLAQDPSFTPAEHQLVSLLDRMARR